MFNPLSDLLLAIIRATVALSLSAGIAWALLNWLNPQSPRLRRVIWLLVLMQGIVLLRIPVAIPWYAADTGFAMPSAVSTVPSALPDVERVNGSASAAPINAEKAGEPISWPPIVFGIWLAGGGITLFWWGTVYVRFARRGAAGQEPSPEWASEWQNVRTQRSVTAAIPLRITEDSGPLLVWRPRGAEVLVPGRLWVNLSSQQRRAILRHELSHYRRGDLWKGSLIRLMALPHWFNPLAWWVVRNLDECAEWLCDDEATGPDHHVAAEYAEVLLRLGHEAGNYGVSATAMRGGRLHSRICRVLTPLPKERSTMKKYVLVAVPLVLLGVHLIRVELVAQAQVPDPARPADSPAKAPFDKAENRLPLRLNFLGTGGLMRLARLRSVQQELEIDRDKIENLTTSSIEEYQAQLSKTFEAGLKTEEKTLELQSEMIAKQDFKLQQLLTSEQLARLRQIALQDAGADALFDAEVAKALEITKEQQEKLAALRREVSEKQQELLNPGDGKRPDTEVIKTKLQELNAQRDKKANEILSKSQLEKFAQLKGKPFDLTLLPPQFAGRSDGRPRMPVGIRVGGLMDVALMEPVLKELGIAKDAHQVSDLRKLREAHAKELRDPSRDPSDNDPENPQDGGTKLQELGRKLQAKFDPELKKVLTPEQYSRLRQIIWQQAGANALEDAEVKKALNIQPDQEEKS